MVVCGACSSSLTRDDLVESYRNSHPDVSEEVASCVVDELVASYAIEGVEAELTAEASSAAFGETQYVAQFHCGQTDDVLGQVTAMLLDRGFEPEQAECVAVDLVGELDDSDLEVLMRGEMTDQFFDKYFTATYDCDALPG